jgi:hypothetical protein
VNGWTAGRSSYPAGTAPDLSASLAEATRLRRANEPHRARQVLTRTIEVASAVPGADPVALTAARRLLAEVLCETGDLLAAYRVAAPLADDARRTLGDRHPATLRTLAVLAAVLHEMGDLDAAERLYRRLAADLAGPVRGGVSARTASLVRVRLALLLRDRGKLGVARDLLTTAYHAHRDAFGPQDADTVHIGAQLADLHRAAGDIIAARRVLTVVYVEARTVLGETDPLTRRIEQDLAEIEPPMPSAPVDLPGDAHSRSLRRRHSRREASDGTGGRGRRRVPADLRTAAPALVRRRPVPETEPAAVPVPVPAAVSVPVSMRAEIPRRPGPLPPRMASGSTSIEQVPQYGGPPPPRPIQHVAIPPPEAPAVLWAPGPQPPAPVPLAARWIGLWRAGGARAVATAAVAIGFALAAVGALALVRAGSDEPTARAVAPVVNVSQPAAPVPTAAQPSVPASSAAATTGKITLRLEDRGATITVQWQLATPAAVQIAVADSPDGPLLVVASVPAGTTSHVLRGLDPQRRYCVRVSTVNAAPPASATTCTE